MHDDRGRAGARLPEVAPPDAYGVDFLEWLRDATEEGWREWLGARWRDPLTDAEIDALERRWDVRFTPDHRLFLRVLHTTTDTKRGGPLFYDWRDDAAGIQRAFDWLVEGLVFDVEQGALWPESWGVRPEVASWRQRRVAELVAAAPRLVPISGHRYVLSEPNVVLSVHQSDIIVYGGDLRGYLLAELGAWLGRPPFPDPKIGTSTIPFWGELIG